MAPSLSPDPILEEISNLKIHERSIDFSFSVVEYNFNVWWFFKGSRTLPKLHLTPMVDRDPLWHFWPKHSGERCCTVLAVPHQEIASGAVRAAIRPAWPRKRKDWRMSEIRGIQIREKRNWTYGPQRENVLRLGNSLGVFINSRVMMGRSLWCSLLRIVLEPARSSECNPWEAKKKLLGPKRAGSDIEGINDLLFFFKAKNEAGQKSYPQHIKILEILAYEKILKNYYARWTPMGRNHSTH